MKKQPKSVKHIINAFIELRSSRPLEKIMITELCEKADINKSTFYAYFKDIYDLSDQLEEQLIKRVLESLPSPEIITSDPAMMTRLLVSAYQANNSLIGILFSGNRISLLPEKIEKSIKELYYSVYPEKKGDIETDLTLSYKIYGAYYAYFKNDYNESEKIDVICRLTAGNERKESA